MEQFSLLCVQNYLDAEPVGTQTAEERGGEIQVWGILNCLVKGNAFDIIYLTTSSPKSLQKTNTR